MCWFFNTTFLEKYYIFHKEKELKSSFDQVRLICEKQGDSSDDAYVQFERICANGNINMLIADQDRNLIWSSYSSAQRFQMQMEDWLYGSDRSRVQVLSSGKDYTLLRQTDERLQSEYLVLLGTLKNGNNLYMRAAVESIRESASITNQFFVMVSMGAIILSVILIIVLSKGISHPIHALSDIARRMTQLDFDAKYIPVRHVSREIDELGNSMNELSETLEETISELKTANVSLQQDIEKKEQIDEMRKEFLSNVSHELKTPITSMKVLADSLLAQPDAPVELYQEFMADIAEEIDRENKIITDLLSLVKMDKKAADLHIENKNINELLELIIKRLTPIADKQDINLVLESFRPVNAEVDETKLTLALSNLVENAIKYNKEGGWVHVSLNVDNKYFYVKVEDSGIGIPKESQDAIFERFYRVDKSHSREIGGTGLGLAITRSAILMHRGAIKVYSKEGEGTTFTVRIPLIYVN